MATAVTICDEATVGGPKRTFVLSLASERLTVRELIIRRATHEVDEYNETRPEHAPRVYHVPCSKASTKSTG